jgi:hypothetical protein
MQFIFLRIRGYKQHLVNVSFSTYCIFQIKCWPHNSADHRVRAR